MAFIHHHTAPTTAPVPPPSLCDWAKAIWGLPERDEVLRGVIGRRVRGRPFLAMRTKPDAPAAAPDWGELRVVNYHPVLEARCCALLNQVATLGPCTVRSFHRDVLDPCSAPERFAWAALDGERVVAFATLRSQDRSGWLPLLDHLAVAPDHRGGGLGERMVQTVRSASLAAGHPQMGLETDAFRAAAIRIYRRCGFEPWPRSEGELLRWRRVLAMLDTR